jgi:hypothetical protein
VKLHNLIAGLVQVQGLVPLYAHKTHNEAVQLYLSNSPVFNWAINTTDCV